MRDNVPVTSALDRMYQCPGENEVLALLHSEMATLAPFHRHALQAALIAPKRISVEDSPGESVVAVASFDNVLLYWSDVEEGWEIAAPSEAGTIPTRGCSQFELGHVMYQLYGEPHAV